MMADTEQPSATTEPHDVPADARDDATAAAILHGDDDTPGGGGLMGGPDDGGAAAGRGGGGNAPNAPLDLHVDAGDAHASDDARAEAIDSPPQDRAADT